MPGNNQQKSEIMGGSGDQQPTFGILPHPAKTNDPADLRQEPPQLGGGLNSNPEWQAFHAKGPHQPSAEVLQNIPAPATRDELKARSAELNK